MKTCEEYVLQELEAVQGKIAELKRTGRSFKTASMFFLSF